MIKRKLRYQTWAQENEKYLEVVHHVTPIISYNKLTGEMTVTTGGWYSPTTKDRLNAYNSMGLSFFTEKGDWYVKDRTDTYPFTDGMIFRNGQLVGGE